MAKKFEYGLEQAVYSIYDEETKTYGTVKSLLDQGSGLISANLSPASDTNDFYADNVVWDSEENNNGYDGTIDMTYMSKDFLKDVLGYEEDDNGVMFENKNAVKPHFAFGFVVKGNAKDRKTWYYYCQAGRSSDEHGTNVASKTYATKTMNLQARPRPNDYEVKATCEKGDTAYETFFDEVYEKVVPSL